MRPLDNPTKLFISPELLKSIHTWRELRGIEMRIDIGGSAFICAVIIAGSPAATSIVISILVNLKRSVAGSTEETFKL